MTGGMGGTDGTDGVNWEIGKPAGSEEPQAPQDAQPKQPERQDATATWSSAEELRELGRRLDDEQRYDEALALYDAALAADPAPDVAVAAWLGKGNVFLDQKRALDVLEAIERALSIDPTSERAWNNKSAALGDLERYDESLAAATRALELDASDTLAWVNQCDALSGLHRYAEALAANDHIIALIPDGAWAWIDRGHILNALERYDEARQAFERVTALAPEEAWGWTELGVAFYRLQRYDDALSAYDQALATADEQTTQDRALMWDNRGDALYILQRDEEALTAYDQAVALDPAVAQWQMDRASVLVALARWDEAVAAAQGALELGLDDEQAEQMRFTVHQALTSLNRPDEARQIVDARIAEAPDDGFAYYLRALLNGDAGQWQTALDGINRALELVLSLADRWYIYRSKGDALSELGQFEQAVSAYQRACEDFPSDVDAWLSLGQALRQLDRDEEAISAFEQALTLDSENIVALSGRAGAFYNLKRYEEAAAAYERATALAPDVAYYWHWRGRSLRWAGHDVEALAAIDQALTLSPDDAASAIQRASALYRLKRYDEAITAYDRALELTPKDSGMWYWKGRALVELNRPLEAIVAYDHAELLGRDDYYFHISVSVALIKLDRKAEALVENGRALKHKPDDERALGDRAWLCSQLGQYADALATCDRLLELQPDNRWARYSRGHALYVLKRYDEAIAAYDAALEVAPNEAEALRWKAEALAQLGRFDEALVAYDAALPAAPDDRALREARDNLAVRLAWDIPDQQMTLPDKRTLGYLDFGDPDGYPVFYFHGLPGSRLEMVASNQMLKDLHIRMITTDRPGLGISSYQRFRTIRKWPRDVAALADHLGIARFAVMGVSGGGPYAAACASALPERVAALGLVSSMTPPKGFKRAKIAWSVESISRWYWSHAPFFVLTLPGAALMAWSMRDRPEVQLNSFLHRERGDLLHRRPRNLHDFFVALIESMSRHFAEAEKIHLAPLERSLLQEPFRQGGRGVARDSWLAVRRWGFSLKRITVPTRLWHGSQDKLVPAATAEYLAEQIPNCQAKFYPNERHGVLGAHTREIFAALLKAAGAPKTVRDAETPAPANVVADNPG